jgi:hypothetical protein
MIVLFTDYGVGGPYKGQVQAVLGREAPGVPVIDLFPDAPVRDPRAAAYLLPAYASEFPAGTVILAVVDPGVGGDRAAGALEADGRWYVGPDNGLFEIVARRSGSGRRWWPLTEHPARLSATFHGRDLFAPLAARLARGEAPPGEPQSADAIRRPHWPDDLGEVVYIDGFGNAMTGLRAGAAEGATIIVGGRAIGWARSFGDVAAGTAFCYENANGLLEIAVNRGRAADDLRLVVGTPVELRRP